ncbi:MAG: glycosyltransferase family 2 protein [Chloroflexi bacterium]|nr:glycosyltransferase family 2 protein [Chloroflexota bacterium]
MIYVVLPAYNEEEALPPLLEKLAHVRAADIPDMHVIIVNDGSADATADVVSDFSSMHPWVELANHPQNRGLSQAIQTGLRRALDHAQSGDIIVTMDADNTQPPQHMLAMRHLIEAQGHDVVVASRFQPGAEVHGVPFMRRLYSRVMSVLFQTILPIQGIRDYSCGYRAYRMETLQEAYDSFGDDFITEEGFACMVEILLQVSRLPETRFGEVPLVLRYDLKPTETKMRVTRTIADTLRLAVKHRARSR